MINSIRFGAVRFGNEDAAIADLQARKQAKIDVMNILNGAGVGKVFRLREFKIYGVDGQEKRVIEAEDVVSDNGDAIKKASKAFLDKGFKSVADNPEYSMGGSKAGYLQSPDNANFYVKFARDTNAGGAATGGATSIF